VRGTRAEIRVRDQALFGFVNVLEKTRERAVYMRREQAANDEADGLRASPSPWCAVRALTTCSRVHVARPSWRRFFFLVLVRPAVRAAAADALRRASRLRRVTPQSTERNPVCTIYTFQCSYLYVRLACSAVGAATRPDTTYLELTIVSKSPSAACRIAALSS
jgi:hypothetical protein